MSMVRIIVTLAGLAISALIAWFFWFKRGNKSATLPEGQVVHIDFMPREPGEFEFHCRMGMFRGKLIVE